MKEIYQFFHSWRIMLLSISNFVMGTANYLCRTNRGTISRVDV